MQTITIRRDLDDLNAEEWHFYFDDSTMQLVLSYYERLQRASKRHKFQVIAKYDRILHRRGISLDDVPLPYDVQVEAKYEFVNKVTVVKERSRR